MSRRRKRRAGFTMLELLISLTILVTAIAIIWSTFDATLRAWKKGGELLEDLHQGDFIMDQIVMAMRSAAYFGSVEGAYGFHLEGRGGGSSAEDEFSWVTSSTALIPQDSPLANGVYRVKIGIENNDEGDPSITVWAYPHLAEDAEDDAEPYHIASGVRGLDCRVYNFEDEAWDEEWEDTNSIPPLIELTLYMDPLEEYGEPVEMTRLIEIPIAHAITSGVFEAEARGQRQERRTGQDENREEAVRVNQPQAAQPPRSTQQPQATQQALPP